MIAGYMLADDRLRIQFETTDPTTQERADADSTPVATLRKNGVAIAISGQNTDDPEDAPVFVFNLETGLYEVIVTLMDEHDFADRHAVYSLSAAVTVGTKEGVAALGEWRIDPVKSYARGVVGDAGIDVLEGNPHWTQEVVIAAPKYGVGYNGYTVQFENDGSGAGTITGSAPSYTVHYEDGVTTLANLRTLVESVGLRLITWLDNFLTAVIGGGLDPYVTDGQVVTLAGGADEESEYNCLASGRAQGGSASTIVIAAAESFADNKLISTKVTILAGPGAGESRRVSSNTNAGDTVNVSPDWITAPTSGSTYRIDRDARANANVTHWREGVPLGLSANGSVFGNVHEVSEDLDAATNLEAMLDGTGLVGPKFPARQDQVFPSYPRTQNEAIAASPYGSWNYGFPCDDAAGGAVGAWGGVTLADHTTPPTYRVEGLLGAVDYAIQMTESAALRGPNNAFLDMTATDDIAVAFAFQGGIPYIDKFSAGIGWSVIHSGAAGTMRFLLDDGPDRFEIDVDNASIGGNAAMQSLFARGAILVAALSRSTNRARIGIIFADGRIVTSVLTDVAALGSVSTAFNVWLGAFETGAGAAVVSFSHVMFGHGVGAATGIPENIEDVLRSLHARVWPARLAVQTNETVDEANTAVATLPSAAQNADAVWDEATAGHVGAGSFGQALGDSYVLITQDAIRIHVAHPTVIQIPPSSTREYRIELLSTDLANEVGALPAPPTIGVVDQDGTDLSARLDSTTMSLVSTGRYRTIYTATAGDSPEELVFTVDGDDAGNLPFNRQFVVVTEPAAVDTSALTAAVTAVGADVERVLGLTRDNSLDDNHTYDPTTGLLTSCRRRVFADASATTAAAIGAANGDDGEIARYTLSFAYAGGKLSGFRAVRAL